ncbi:DNA-directed RNA polymerase specialized sigma subunit, sigma24 family [Blastococcus aggregatus]|uniref:DNA-directed RNA polymerase specialized sigma subunit, sigma24 family n=1 Tax=Blastococcus aggregatus TaxID=38502 RepID=A0A285VAE7_9ACTN|nr:DNA-directed RNA polymerase specialized sigma subunit, sigma24 family [Blastococcus aggregatus]
MLLRLQLSNYAPAVWNLIAEEFARYGLAVISSWIRRGLIFGYVTKATGFGFPNMDSDRVRDPETVHDLASMTVVNALGAFLEVALKKNNWSPSKGASLKTYFIGQCKIQFANVYKEWWRAEGRRPRSESLDQLVERNVLAPVHDNVEASFNRDAELSEALTMVESAEAQSALVYQAEGYTYAEIATFIGAANPKVVENLIFRWKRRVQEMAAGKQESA